MSDHRSEIDAWHAERVAKLAAPHGWLSLVGRWVLDDDGADVPGGRAVRVDGGARVPVEGGHLVLRPGETAADGARRWELNDVGGDLVLRLRDPESPTRAAFRGIDRYPVDERWRVPAKLVRDDAPAAFVYQSGATVPARHAGRLDFAVDGVPRSLSATFEGDDRLFVLFADLTNGDTTYGAGRFLYVPWRGHDDVVVDFNRAYNPPCALTGFANCPLVPPENRLPFRIEAGERYPLP